MNFLPELPPAMHASLLFGGVLVLGLLGGEGARRAGLPVVSGYIGTGLLLGQSALGTPVHEHWSELRIIVDVALGLVLFDLGRRLDLGWMRRDPSLWVAAGLEMVMSFCAVLASLILLDVAPLDAAVISAIGMATSPAVVWLVARDARAQGQVTDRCLTLAALNGLIAFVLVASLLGGFHYEQHAGWIAMLVHPLYLLGGSILLGAATAATLLGIVRVFERREEVHFAVMIAIVLCAVGVASTLKLSVVIALLAAGAALRNAPRRFALLELELGSGARPLYASLFVITGAALPAVPLDTIGWAAVAFIAARALFKVVGVIASAPISPLPWKHTALLGFTLLPMSAVAVVLMHDVARLFPSAAARIAAVVVPAIVFFELIGPPLVHGALRRAGDVPSAGE